MDARLKYYYAEKMELSKDIDICADNEQPCFRHFPMYIFRGNAQYKQHINKDAYFITNIKLFYMPLRMKLQNKFRAVRSSHHCDDEIDQFL